MLRAILDARLLIVLAIAAVVGTYGLRAYPMRGDEVFLAVVEARRPDVFRMLAYGYALLWFSTPFYLASVVASLFAIAVYRSSPNARFRALPPYPAPEERPTPSLILGEAHHQTRTGRAAEP